MRLLHWWMRVLNNTSPAEAAALSIVWALVAAIVFGMVRWLIAFWRYTPPEAPRAPGIKHRRIG